MTSEAESHPLLRPKREGDVAPAKYESPAYDYTRLKQAALVVFGLATVCIGVVSLLPEDHMSKTVKVLIKGGVFSEEAGTGFDGGDAASSPPGKAGNDMDVDDDAVIDYETISPEELWLHLDHPDNVLGFVRYHMLKEAGLEEDGVEVETFDDEYFTGLSCSMYDDDEEYPNPQCIKGDNLTCTTGIQDNYYYEQTCSTACAESWGVPCGWSAMKNLPDVCDDRETGPNKFVAQFPGASKNLSPDNVEMKNTFVPSSDGTSGHWYWACNVHAFCYECVDDDNKVDDYCKATVIRSKSMYAPSAVFKYLDDYWCNQTIFDAIDAGTYCGYAVDKLHSCAYSDEVS